MRINGEETDILRSYRSNDAEGRLAIMLNNYAVFPRIIRKAEKKIQYKPPGQVIRPSMRLLPTS